MIPVCMRNTSNLSWRQWCYVSGRRARQVISLAWSGVSWAMVEEALSGFLPIALHCHYSTSLIVFSKTIGIPHISQLCEVPGSLSFF